ncbi:MAG: helix-turn-helix transcriptional regulator, partial [Clostridia bacterium]|nr:helix-turn-helix transcriptional regulator [Clostridia bacterium]
TTPGNLSILTKGILFYTISIISSNQNPVLQRADVNIVEQIRTDIECMYANSELSLVSLCSRYKYNHKYVSRKFREEVGVTFTEYLQTCRLQHACHLLRETNRTVYDIAIGVGFRDAMYFSRVFKKSTGMTPLQYRHMHKE